MKFRKQIMKPYVPASILGIRQEGGEIMVEEPSNMQPEGGDPMQELLMGAQQAVEANDGQLALQVCAMLLEMAMGAAQEAPMEEAPMEEMPMEEGM
jgi:hypothetical protein